MSFAEEMGGRTRNMKLTHVVLDCTDVTFREIISDSKITSACSMWSSAFCSAVHHDITTCCSLIASTRTWNPGNEEAYPSLRASYINLTLLTCFLKPIPMMSSHKTE